MSDKLKHLFGIDDIAVGLGVSALIGGVTSLASSSASNSSSKYIAEQNLQAVRETNEANRSMTEQTNQTNAQIAADYNANQVELQNQMNQFNLKQWERNNEYNARYNSPSAIIERATMAGLNPNSAMGFAVPASSSPVQQTALPAQMMPKYESSKDIPAKKELQKDFSFIKDIGRQIADMPFYKERIEGMRLANQQQRIDNDIRKFDLAEKENEKHMFDNFGYIRSVDGQDFISSDEYQSLSDNEKSKYLKPTGYRHAISDKLISVEHYKGLPDEQKDLYKPSFDGSVPELVKLPFRSRKAFEDWKALQAVPSTLSNIRADNLQNKLRSVVAEGQLKDNDVAKALVSMPTYQFKKLQKEVLKVDAEVQHDLQVNKGLSDRLKSQDDIARYTAYKLKNDLDKDFITVLEKHLPSGAIRDFLIGAYAFLKSFK